MNSNDLKIAQKDIESLYLGNLEQDNPYQGTDIYPIEVWVQGRPGEEVEVHLFN